MAGCLITIEGIDGAGKTTQASLLYQYCQQRNRPVSQLREPGNTPTGKAVRAMIRQGKNIPPNQQLLLFAIARAELYSTAVHPALRQGRIIILDRSIDSTVAYQGYGAGLNLRAIHQANRLATGGRVPDLTFILEINPATAAGRTTNPDLRSGHHPDEYRERVSAGFLAQARNNPERCIIVDADREIERIAKEIAGIAEARMKARRFPPNNER